jgi:hypothetical protein
MRGSSSVVAQLVASQEGLGSVSKYILGLGLEEAMDLSQARLLLDVGDISKWGYTVSN